MTSPVYMLAINPQRNAGSLRNRRHRRGAAYTGRPRRDVGRFSALGQGQDRPRLRRAHASQWDGRRAQRSAPAPVRARRVRGRQYRGVSGRVEGEHRCLDRRAGSVAPRVLEEVVHEPTQHAWIALDADRCATDLCRAPCPLLGKQGKQVDVFGMIEVLKGVQTARQQEFIGQNITQAGRHAGQIEFFGETELPSSLSE